jgi:hypothetical protein
MSFLVKKASKQAKKLRVLLSASSGSGKTLSSLLMAHGITNDWSKIVLIDTENHSASMYADLGDFQVINFDAPFSPERYIEAITTAEESGAEVIIIDSITHEWAGEGGCLSIHSKLGGTFNDWGKVTPRHNLFIQKMLNCKTHLIATVRRKESYSIITTSTGKTKVEKHGLDDVQRDGINYEFDLVFEIINEHHLARATKDRTGLFAKKEEAVITAKHGQILIEWANSGTTEIDEALKMIREADGLERLKNIHSAYVSLHTNEDYIKALGNKKKEFVGN